MNIHYALYCSFPRPPHATSTSSPGRPRSMVQASTPASWVFCRMAACSRPRTGAGASTEGSVGPKAAKRSMATQW